MTYFVFWAHRKSSARGLCPEKYSIIFSSVGQNLQGKNIEFRVNYLENFGNLECFLFAF